MYTLAFDTTVNFCSVALFENNKMIDSYVKEMNFGQAEALIPAISQILESRKLTFKDLKLLVVCTGPGSFTGVRSSVAAARAFGLACPQTTICGVSAFDAYAAELAPDELADINAILIETKREDYYIQYYDRHLNKTEPPTTAYRDDIIQTLSGKKVTLSGDGTERFLNRPSGLSLHTVKMPLNPPIDKLGLIGINKYQSKTTDFPKPLYLKAPDVCVK